MGYKPKHVVARVRALSWKARAVIVVAVALATAGGGVAYAVTSDVPVSNGQLQGQVSVCVSQANESAQYVELHHPAPGNCAKGYVQYHANEGLGGVAPDDDSGYVKTSDLPAAIKANDDDSAVGGLAGTFTLSQGGQTSTCSVKLASGTVSAIDCAQITSGPVYAVTGTAPADVPITTAGFDTTGTVSLSLSGAPSWVSLSGSNLHFTAPIGAAGSYSFTVTATEGSQKAVQTATLTVS